MLYALSWALGEAVYAAAVRACGKGRSKREIIRSLKRYVARELYRYLPRPH